MWQRVAMWGAAPAGFPAAIGAGQPLGPAHGPAARLASAHIVWGGQQFPQSAHWAGSSADFLGPGAYQPGPIVGIGPLAGHSTPPLQVPTKSPRYAQQLRNRLCNARLGANAPTYEMRGGFAPAQQGAAPQWGQPARDPEPANDGSPPRAARVADLRVGGSNPADFLTKWLPAVKATASLRLVSIVGRQVPAEAK